jgi:outer membrane protein TolC
MEDMERYMPTGKTRKSTLADAPSRTAHHLRLKAETAAALDSLAWHGDALRETERRYEAGQEQPVDWAAAKQELRESRGESVSVRKSRQSFRIR